uniref:Granaticin polyketide synthase bifunctional cyclase/dehydratase n=1 Tax=Streptomyces virginiae TaxID=1961 RepID=CYPK_STRVG|nr:RecName: Full=Granaticin polyketide synthase bifunctional cyclase/dehydratase; AltName: Full=ORF4 [Streptomyces virginiae]CAA77600.1 bifunctional cyclase/dehydratase [Streptomyces virginiae]
MTTRQVEHEYTIGAPAATVYRLLADVSHWPQIFPPTIHVERQATGAHQERIHIWATANGQAKNWTSRRTLDPEALRIDSASEVTTAPVAAMGGTWIVEPLGADSSRIRLLHDSGPSPRPQDLQWIDRAVDTTRHLELAALATTSNHAHAAEERELLSFTDTCTIDGAAKDVFDFVNEADRWPERLPHVATVRFEEPAPGLQILEMDTRAKDGSVHTTKSYRVALDTRKIAYKQVTLPALMTLHTGVWTFTRRPGHHRGELAAHRLHQHANIAKIPRRAGQVADARDYVHSALSTNSRAPWASQG